MFCPKCKSEYKEGISKCADCDVALINNLPPEMELEPDFIEYENVLETYNHTDVAMIQSLLDGSGITYYADGEMFSNARPFIEPVRIMVKTDQVEMAKEVLSDLKLNYLAISTD
jgi:hypothetical protein